MNLRVTLLKQLVVAKQLVFTFEIIKFKQNGEPDSSKLSSAHINTENKRQKLSEPTLLKFWRTV